MKKKPDNKETSLARSSAVDYLTFVAAQGQGGVEVVYADEDIWLTQKMMGVLYDVKTPTINYHLKTLFADNELAEDSVIRKFRITAADGKNYDTGHYNLSAVIAVGYKVNSERAVQFRKWATTVVKEFTIKGFAMDDERLKNPGGWEYFDELLARNCEIRASEKRFYQKVRDLFALSTDYQAREKETSLLLAEVQNKLLYAANRQTPAELIVARADPSQPNMVLTTWSGSRVRKQDMLVAKNYLSADEVDTFNLKIRLATRKRGQFHGLSRTLLHGLLTAKTRPKDLEVS